MSNLTGQFGGDRGLERWVPRLVFAGALATLALGTGLELARQRHVIARSTATADLAAVAGPPCPAVPAAAFRQALKTQELTLKYVFKFNSDAFGRAIGDAQCDGATAKGTAGLGSYDVCEFTSPAVLHVKTGKGEFFFLPGVGRKATVTTADGIGRCVLAAPKLD
jgi:hypothetical protein